MTLQVHGGQVHDDGDLLCLELLPELLLPAPLPTANPEGRVQALATCERESALLQLEPEGYPGPEAIAEVLHMTPRTYRRRLQEMGLSYKQLLEEARRRDACALLERPEMEVRRIAELLGYSDPANSMRAFRPWTGRAPREWRGVASWCEG